MTDKYVIRMLVAGTILFVVLGVFIFVLIVYMRYRQNAYYVEKQKLFDKQTDKIGEYERVSNETAKHLHDDVLQVASLLKLQINKIKALNCNPKQLEQVGLMQDITTLLVENTSRMCSLLNMDYMMSHSLSTLVERALCSLFQPKNMEYNVTSNGTYRAINGDIKVVVYRIVLEAIKNIDKHAGASKVDISIDYTDRSLSVRIKDDGQGFASAKTHAMETTGLSRMYQRAKSLNAELSIESSLDEGCVVTLSCPC